MEDYIFKKTTAAICKIKYWSMEIQAHSITSISTLLL